MAVLEMLVLSQSGLKGFDESLGEIDFIINYFLPKIPPSSPLSGNQPHSSYQPVQILRKHPFLFLISDWERNAVASQENQTLIIDCRVKRRRFKGFPKDDPDR